MSPEPRTPELCALESLLSFWTACGVDTLVGDAPLDRTVVLARLAAAAPSPTPAPRVNIARAP
ncbi:MAG: hypothetical protein JWO83_3250, partial [Caulobacteraceae bacterium]|nr:hypothetical protein [Caulobacteraceae bacterium]